MAEINYSDAERRAYADGDTERALLLARIADLQDEVEELEKKLENARDEAYSEGYAAAEAEHDA